MAVVVNASTSVVLISSSNQPVPIVYFPPISTLGRLVTVRDSDGFVSTGNTITLVGSNGVTFGNGEPTLSITQPYGFITLTATTPDNYSILNTFAFPAGSTAAYVSNVNVSTMTVTNTLYSQDLVDSYLNTITTSNGELLFNNAPIGNVTSAELISTTVGLEEFASNLLYINVQRLVAAGYTSNTVSNIPNPTGTLLYSDNTSPFDVSSGGTGGFSNGADDVYYGGVWVACGNNSGGVNSSNTGFLQWSLDGKYWVNSASPVLDLTRRRTRIFWANNLYHAVGYSVGFATSGGANTILWSSDGSNWNPSQATLSIPFLGTNPLYNYATGITFGFGNWVASGIVETGVGNSLLYSGDGSNWSNTSVVGVNPGTLPSAAYDVGFNGSRFIAIVKNGTGPNLATSSNGIVWATTGITNGSLGNEPGYIAATPSLWLAVTKNYRKFSVDGGFTWQNIQGFPAGYPFRPYYDGNKWWVSVSTNTTAQSIYTSFGGSNAWSNWTLGGGFSNGGYAKSFYSIYQQSNLNLQLLSSMQGISINFSTSNLQASNIVADNISANQITLGKDSVTTINNFYVACVRTSVSTNSLWWSPNGQIYSPAVSGGFNNGAYNVGYNGTNLWVAAGSASNPPNSNNPRYSLQWSTDAKNWYPAASGGFAWGNSTICEARDVKYANGYWVAVGCNDVSSRTLLRSIDGSNWAPVDNLPKFSTLGYAVSPGTNSIGQFMWVATGPSVEPLSTMLYSVDNGGSWSNLTSGGFISGQPYAITYANATDLPLYAPTGLWVAVGKPSAIPGDDGIQLSVDGANWINSLYQSYTTLQGVNFNPYTKNFVAVGGFTTGTTGTLNAQSTIITSSGDANYWNSANTGGFRAVAGLLGGTSVTYSESNWYASGFSSSNTAIVYSSSNSSNWTLISQPPLVNTSTITAVYDGITTTTQIIGKVFISAGTILANQINLNNGLMSNICSMRFSKIDIAGVANTSVSLGTNAGLFGQAQDAIAIGTTAGFCNQLPYAIAIGQNAGNTNQAQNAVAIGINCGAIQQGSNSVGIGTNCGFNLQAARSVGLGYNSGYTIQGQEAVAIGFACGFQNQGVNAVAIGSGCGNYFQQPFSVAIGYSAGSGVQGGSAVAIGNTAGGATQGGNSVAIGCNAGSLQQGINAIALGTNAGGKSQTNSAVAIGEQAGASNQGLAVALGWLSGQSNQGNFSLAAGFAAGRYLQGTQAVAIGLYAATSNQGNDSIAIGYAAGSNNQHANTIILNASGSAFTTTQANSFFVKPVRNATTFGTQLNYDNTTGEITYGTPSDSNLKEHITATSNYFDALCQLRPIEFSFKQDATSTRHIGFIAQEVKPLLPALVEEHNSTLYMNYNAFHPMYITAFQSLQSTNQSLQARLDKQEQLIQALYAKLNLSP